MRLRERVLAALVVLFALALAPRAARAQLSLVSTPDYYGSVWFRIGVTSEARLVFGLSADLLPASAGIEISPRSQRGLVRAFAGLKWGFLFPNTCSFFPRASAGAVLALGPSQPAHFGLRLGAHFEHTPMPEATPNPSFPQMGEALSFRFSWIRDAGFLHEAAAEIGPYWAPHADCQSD